ncbi:MAG: hypothetical protein AAFQ63_12125 [Cyanobacteria bacterium J06621_11]
MAAPISTSATTLEGQLAEVAAALQVAEAAVTENPENRVNIQFDVENGQIAIGATLPATFSHNGATVSMEPTSYVA